MITIDAVYLPEEVERGALGGPLLNTTVLSNQSGVETTLANWSIAKHRWTFSINYMRQADFLTVKAFFLARLAKARGWLLKDWSDYVMPRQTFATGNGATTDFILGNLYPDSVNPYTRIITRPKMSTLKVYVGGVLKTITTDYTFTTGKIHFLAAPANLAAIEAECEFDNPVRFDTDFLPQRVAWSNAIAIENFDIFEINEYGQTYP